MKRPLFAAAALCAFAHSASAQSSVTVWGIVDAWVGRIDKNRGNAARIERRCQRQADQSAAEDENVRAIHLRAH